eukprot:CAMPEP_0195293330 /NCGR_PEP_ID=MMETSP0707-20130614/12175_1 /TAXON_ID=33640 /ORGANISM="Asterionellopsis glacialis, Strain CCMP134" /LENGTH=370 /DNA_ID=CAMNT_0040354015 /DNA_START=214 /DNA_END=1326 /DNA_ORIENTATION=-
MSFAEPVMDPTAALIPTAENNLDALNENGNGKKKGKKKKDPNPGYRKAPQAPKRFKSPYILFSMSKMEDFKKEAAEKGSSKKVTSISRRIADAWKALPSEERKKWDDFAKQDKLRYNAEKSLYTGPWQVPSKRTRKDPSAPKRPMSAFLFFSQGMRQKLKAENPDLKNTQISCLLGKRWKTASEDERRPHIERERKEREEYKKNIADWREKKDVEEKAMRKRRQDIAEQFVKSGLFEQGYNTPYPAQQNQSIMPVYGNAPAVAGAPGNIPQYPVTGQGAQMYAPQFSGEIPEDDPHHASLQEAADQFAVPAVAAQGQPQEEYQPQVYQYMQTAYEAPQDINQAPVHQQAQTFQLQQGQTYSNVECTKGFS